MVPGAPAALRALRVRAPDHRENHRTVPAMRCSGDSNRNSPADLRGVLRGEPDLSALVSEARGAGGIEERLLSCDLGDVTLEQREFAARFVPKAVKGPGGSAKHALVLLPEQ